MISSLMTGVLGLEPRLTVLETGILPLDDAPLRAVFDSTDILSLIQKKGKHFLSVRFCRTGFAK